MTQDLLALVALALLDSTSLGTLVIPLMLVVRQRRVDVALIGAYLATVCTAYYVLGIVLLTGVDLLTDIMMPLTRMTALRWTGLALGAGLALFGVLCPSPRKPEARGGASTTSTTRVRLASRPTPSSLGAVVALGLAATATEAATMVPYIAASGIISSTSTAWSVRLAILAGYCLVMVLPTLVLTGTAATLQERFLGRLERIVPRLEYETKVTLLWVAALVGLHMAVSNALALGLI